jgi:hypothetical protein
MMQLLPFMAPAFALLLLLLLLRKRPSAPLAARPFPAEPLDAFSLELPPRELMERVCARQDFEFVSANAPRQVRRAFQRERRSMAIAWVRQASRQAQRWMAFYSKTVRHSASLSPSMELKLALQFAAFHLTCFALMTAIWLGGPVRARILISHALGLSERLALEFDRVLAGVNPVRATARAG